MSNKRRRFPGIPQGKDDITKPVAEALGILTGQRGDKMDRAITFRDLVDKGLLSWKDVRKANPDPDQDTEPTNPPPPLTVPPAPTGLEASGAFENVILEWDAPQAAYSNHAYTEIWRLDNDNLANAQKVGQAQSSVYSDPIGGGKERYYWIRFVSTAGRPGPYNDSSGTLAETATDPAYLREQLADEIRSTELHDTLQGNINSTIRQQSEPIAKPDGSALVAGDIWQEVDASDNLVKEYIYNGIEWVDSGAAPKAFVNEEIVQQVGVCRDGNNDIKTAYDTKDACESADYTWDDSTALAEQINTVSSTAGDNSAAIQTEAETRASEDDTIARYSVKTDVNGHVAGFGIETSEGQGGETSSTFIVSADYFAVGSPDTPDQYPFAIGTVNGDQVVTISNAAIEDASITNLKVGEEAVDVSKIAKEAVVESKIADGSVTNLKIGNYIESNNYTRGEQGWRIDKNGDLEANDAVFRGSLEAANGTFSGTLTADAVNAVDTLNIRDHAVTIPVNAYTSSAKTVSGVDGGYWITVQEASITSGGGVINATIGFEGHLEVSCGGAYCSGSVSARLRRNGYTVLFSTSSLLNAAAISNETDSDRSLFSFPIADVPGSGSHTYYLEVFVSGTTGSTTYISNRSIMLIEAKK